VDNEGHALNSTLTQSTVQCGKTDIRRVCNIWFKRNSSTEWWRQLFRLRGFKTFEILFMSNVNILLIDVWRNGDVGWQFKLAFVYVTSGSSISWPVTWCW